MEQLNYVYHPEVVDASEWVPQKRQRVYILCLKRGHGDPHAVFSMLRKTQPRAPPCLVDFLELPPGENHHPVNPLPSPKPFQSGHKVKKWQLKTKAYIELHELPVALMAAVSRRLRSFPAFAERTAREQYLLIVKYAWLIKCKGTNPFKEAFIFDISQSVDRVPGGKNVSPCVTPRARLWISHQGRLLTAAEHGKLQGLTGTGSILASETLLKDLIGNGFCIPVLTGLWLGILLTVNFSEYTWVQNAVWRTSVCLQGGWKWQRSQHHSAWISPIFLNWSIPEYFVNYPAHLLQINSGQVPPTVPPLCFDMRTLHRVAWKNLRCSQSVTQSIVMK